MNSRDEVLAAFCRVRPDVTVCHRGGVPGYTHVHSPHQHRGVDRCTTHWIVIECYNGTVAVRRPLAPMLGALPRPDLPITEHPLGYSHQRDYGQFDHAIDVSSIMARWGSLDAFAAEVVRCCEALNGW